MPCEIREIDGVKMIVCSRRAVALCVNCGAVAPFLCDYEVEPGKTCDVPLCGQCSVHSGTRDYCPAHAGKVGRLYGI